MKNLKHLIAAVTVLCMYACESEKTIIVPAPDTLNGTFIVNEGAFNQGNGEIAFISTDSSYVNDKLYFTVNNQPLGDVVQSMSVFNDNAYIAVNNSQKVVVVSMKDFKKKAIININSPRFVTGIPAGNRVMISDWSDNTVKVVDATTFAIKKSIPAGNGPEQLCYAIRKVFVCNVGGFGNDSTVTVITTSGDSVLTTLAVGVNPNSIVRDGNGKIWVLCGGSLGNDFIPSGDDTGGELLEIDPVTLVIEKTFHFAQQEHPVKLQADPSGNKLFYLMSSSAYNGQVYTILTSDINLPASPLIARDFYGLGIQSSGNIYCGSGGFTAAGYAVRYTNAGVLIDSVKVGIAPNSFVFN